MDWLAFISARVGTRAEFPVFFPVTREIGISETSSLVTASSSGESCELSVPERRKISELGAGGACRLVLAAELGQRRDDRRLIGLDRFVEIRIGSARDWQCSARPASRARQSE